jgi:hypothetical protein
MRLTCCLLILISNACPAWAWIRLNGIFTDNMVLQTPGPGLPPARIFGLAYTSEQVVIEGSTAFPGPSITVTPVRSGLQGRWGNWSVDLLTQTDRLTPSVSQPFSITIRSKQNTSDIITLNNVVFGEVIFCAG